MLMLNRLFLGNPGTGKTTVAEIYGKILTTLKFLSNGELMMKVGSDFVGDKVGEAQDASHFGSGRGQGAVD